MPLDPQAQKVLDATAALGLPPTEQMTPAEARESMRSRTAALGPVEDVARVDDHRVPVDGGTITVRCYTPAGRGPFPAYIYFHGGGWVIGDIETHDGICRSLANASGSVVASVDYRLAPEHKYPVAAEDAYAATMESYRAGLGTFIDLLAAQRELARARTTNIASRADLLTSAAALAFATGEMPPTRAP